LRSHGASAGRGVLPICSTSTSLPPTSARETLPPNSRRRGYGLSRPRETSLALPCRPWPEQVRTFSGERHRARRQPWLTQEAMLLVWALCVPLLRRLKGLHCLYRTCTTGAVTRTRPVRLQRPGVPSRAPPGCGSLISYRTHTSDEVRHCRMSCGESLWRARLPRTGACRSSRLAR